MLNIQEIRKDFPILNRKVHDKRLVYLDNAATSQVPVQVLKAVEDFETNHRANVHRGVHVLSEEATNAYESARTIVSKFIGAVVPNEVVFVRNTTEAINLVAFAWGRKNIKEGDVILIGEAEHHSNLIPWQQLAEEKNASLAFIPISSEGILDLKGIDIDWTKVRLVAFNHASNVLGTITDAKEVVKFIKRRVIESKKLSGGEENNSDNFPRILIDGAQAVPHMPVNVQSIGCDFYAFSGHKMCGPMGIGVLWINRDLFDEIGEFLTGGGMIKEVTLEKSTFAKIPERFEGGTPNVTGAIGLAAACDYLSAIGMDNIREHEIKLANYLVEKLKSEDDIQIQGMQNSQDRSGVVSFNMTGVPSHDLAAVLDSEGVAIRSGQHCVMPWHVASGVRTTARASIYIYNDTDDIDVLVKALAKARKVLKGE